MKDKMVLIALNRPCIVFHCYKALIITLSSPQKMKTMLIRIKIKTLAQSSPNTKCDKDLIRWSANYLMTNNRDRLLTGRVENLEIVASQKAMVLRKVTEPRSRLTCIYQQNQHLINRKLQIVILLKVATLNTI